MEALATNERPVAVKRPSKFFFLTPARTLALGFAGAIAIGTALLMLPVSTASGRGGGFLESLFTATSATCVTGLIVVDTATYWTPFGQVVIAALIQVGGLGIMTMSTLFAFLLGRRINLRGRLLIQEATGALSLAGVVRLIKSVLLFTVLFEGLGALILAVRWSFDYPWPRALALGAFHSVSAFNNAGFDLFSVSLQNYASDAWALLTVAGLIIVGGIGFAVIADVYARMGDRHHRLSLHSRLVLRVTAGLLLGGTLLIFLLEYGNTLQPLPVHGKILSSFFHAVTPRTAGFNSLPMGALHPATLLLIVVLMFIGASPGSTGGGIKTTTFATLIAAVHAIIAGSGSARVGERRLPRQVVDRALAVAAIALGLVVAVTGVMLLSEHKDMLALLFETTSAFGTVGLSTGITPDLSPLGRVLMILTMYAGRVGPLTLVLAIGQRQRHATTAVQYPEERVMIG